MAATTEQIDDKRADAMLKEVYDANTSSKQMTSIGVILDVMISDDLSYIQENIDKLIDAGLINSLAMSLTWKNGAIIVTQLRVVLILLEVYGRNDGVMTSIVESPLLEVLAPHISTQSLAVNIVYQLCGKWSNVLCYVPGAMDNLRTRIESTPDDATAKDALSVLETATGSKTKRAIA